MRSVMLTAALILTFGSAQPARAAWMRASSDHFVIYSDDSERGITQFAERLERYHVALTILTASKVATPSPSNRVTVFVVSDIAAVRKLFGEGNRYVGGFYIPRAGASVAFVPRTTANYAQGDGATITLLHEYAHHFMASANSQALPRWMIEGSAEFFSSASFEKDGGIKIGRPAMHRAYELFNERDVKAADLLDSTQYDKRNSKAYDAFYGKSWLLYHYLTFEPSRSGQFEKYVAAIGMGTEWRKAALDAFGDFEQLEKELDRYVVRSRMSSLNLRPGMIPEPKVSVDPLSPGEAVIMPIRLRSRRGVDQQSAQLVLAQARLIAARYPRDPAVLSVLAEAEYDAGHDKEAITAADAALALDSSQTNAYVQKGFALFRMAADADDTAAAYQRAMAPFAKLNKIENDHPLPLIYFYRTQVMRGQKPTKLALAGLRRASELAPFDARLRVNLAFALIKERQIAEAREALKPVGFNPHGGSLSSGARRVLAKFDNEPDWNGSDAEAMMGSAAEEPDTADASVRLPITRN